MPEPSSAQSGVVFRETSGELFVEHTAVRDYQGVVAARNALVFVPLVIAMVAAAWFVSSPLFIWREPYVHKIPMGKTLITVGIVIIGGACGYGVAMVIRSLGARLCHRYGADFVRQRLGREPAPTAAGFDEQQWLPAVVRWPGTFPPRRFLGYGHFAGVQVRSDGLHIRAETWKASVNPDSIQNVRIYKGGLRIWIDDAGLTIRMDVRYWPSPSLFESHEAADAVLRLMNDLWWHEQDYLAGQSMLVRMTRRLGFGV